MIVQGDEMSSEMEVVEQRLKSFLGQLKTEHDILDRMVYKNKNQHRRCFYFQYLLKVRRDLRLLQLAKLEEILNASFDVITGKRPRQKVQLLESLKRRRGDTTGKYNFLERLLGVARLLSQMVEPMLKAATEISTLLARSFFMGFSLTILSLLARLRVLVQQILLDVVSVFNTVSSVSRKGQAVKLKQDGLQVLRECYPTKEQAISLECVWQTDKFLLVEKTNEGEAKTQENTSGDFSSEAPIIKYQSLEVFLGDDNEAPEHTPGEGLNNVKKVETSSLMGPVLSNNDEKQVENGSVSAGSPGENILTSEDVSLRTSDSASRLSPLKRKSGSKEVAFISIKRPVPATTNALGLGVKGESEKSDGDKEDPFFSLLTGGNMKSSLF